jgi:hypothetical protein
MFIKDEKNSTMQCDYTTTYVDFKERFFESLYYFSLHSFVYFLSNLTNYFDSDTMFLGGEYRGKNATEMSGMREANESCTA